MLFVTIMIQVIPGCDDCEVTLTDDNETLCPKCVKRRGERKEIITEIVDTEIKYGKDLKIIVEEFYRPMLVAGLLSSDQLASIFLNVEQLIQVSAEMKTIQYKGWHETYLIPHNNFDYNKNSHVVRKARCARACLRNTWKLSPILY